MTKCPAGYTLNKEKGECFKVVCPDTFLYDDSEKKCIKYRCPDRYEMTSPGKCERKSCPEGYLFQNKQCYKLEKCPQYFKLVKNMCVRSECPEGFEKEGEDCIKRECPEGFSLVEKECLKKNPLCTEGYVVKGDKCVKTTCPADYQYDNQTKMCLRASCDKANGYTYNTTSKKCEKTVCPESYTLDEATKKCQKMVCPEGFAFDEYYKKCIKRTCPDGYQFNEKTTLCEKVFCKNHFVLEMLTTGDKCVLIKTVAPPVVVDESDLSLSEAVARATTNFGGLEKRMKTDIFGCNLSLEGAKARCEKDHGEGKCVQVSPTAFNKKCPEGYMNWQSTKCVKPCPNNWQFDDKGLFCQKVHTYLSPLFASAEDCRINRWKAQCVKLASGQWSPVCKKGFTRSGSNLCVPSCPTSWGSVDNMCIKPQPQELGAPYTWTNGDN